MIPLVDLKKSFKSGSFRKLYVFTGPEVAIMDIYIKQLANHLGGADIINLDSMLDVLARCKSRTMLSGARRMFVVRNDKSYLTAEKVWDAFIQGAAQRDAYVVLVYSNLDKRTKFYKQHDRCMVMFDELPASTLAKYIQKEVNLSTQDAVYLAEVCDCNYSRILLECDKILALGKARDIEDEEALDILLREGHIYVPPRDAIFDLVDSLCRGLVKTSFEHLQDCIGIGEHPLAILLVLYNNLRSIYVVKMDGGDAGVVERTGLTAFQVKLAKEKMGAYSLEELVRAMRIVRQAEKGIKTGAIDAEIAVPYAMTKILGGEGFQF